MASPSERSDEAAWSELEQAFFASAPPDDPPPAPPGFDESPVIITRRTQRDRLHGLARRALTAITATRATLEETLRRLRALTWLAPFRMPRLDRRGVTIAIASTVVLMGLSAVVVASRSNGSAGTPAMALASTTPASVPVTEPGVAGRARTGELPRPHTRASKRTHAHASTAKHGHREHRKVATATARTGR